MGNPSPIAFSSSQVWDGNDGQWSSFVVRVGTPEQSFRVFPGTNTGETFIPTSDGCTNADPSNCPTSRGVFPFDGISSHGFLINKSATWNEIGVFDAALRPVLNLTGDADFGLDKVGLMYPGSGGPTLSEKVVGAISDKRVYVGLFGLSPLPSNFTDIDHPIPSIMQTLKDQDTIPSVSYGYTAGAYYKTPSAFGSLTLGGLDQARRQPNNITFPFDDGVLPLSLNVQSITARDTFNGTLNLLTEPTYYHIDFSVPHLWLPVPACDKIASAFGLQYDNHTDLYRINDTTHNDLLQNNPSITIGLGTTSDPTERVNIVLPYKAFDHKASYPIYPNATNYFPIRRAHNETQYTLGRSFFQEAYVVVDYGRKIFSLHQALFPSSSNEQQITPISDPNQRVTPSNTTETPHDENLSKGAIAGISIGSVAFVVVFALLLMIFFRLRKAHRKPELDAEQEERGIQEAHTTEKAMGEASEMFEPGHELEGVQKAELACSPLYELDNSVRKSAQELPADTANLHDGKRKLDP